MDDLIAVVCIDDPLLVLHPDEFVPFMQIHMIISPNQEGSPVFKKVAAFRFSGDFFGSRNGKNKMKIRVNQLLVFNTRGTGPT
jgi:hypothetical protein